MFSPLSESGFIPTVFKKIFDAVELTAVLISFREWLHSYENDIEFLLRLLMIVLISFREWLHSYFLVKFMLIMNSQSSSHLFQRVASFLQSRGTSRI